MNYLFFPFAFACRFALWLVSELPLFCLRQCIPVTLGEFFALPLLPLFLPFYVLSFFGAFLLREWLFFLSLRSKPLRRRLRPGELYLGEELVTTPDGMPYETPSGETLVTGLPLSFSWEEAVCVFILGSPGTGKSALADRIMAAEIRQQK